MRSSGPRLSHRRSKVARCGYTRRFRCQAIVSSRLLRNACVTENSLQLEEFLEPGLAPFPAITRLLVASEAASEVNSRAIDVYISRTNLLSNPVRALQISRSHKA